MHLTTRLQIYHSQNVQVLNTTPIQSNLSPFDNNYTLTGLVRHIQMSLNQVILNKQNIQNLQSDKQQSEMQKLMKIRQEVGVLKTIIIHNINQIFSDLYPSGQDCKKSDKTNHTHSSNPLKNEPNHHKSMTTADFEVETVNEQIDQIKNLEVNKESLSHHNNIYPQIVDLNEPMILIDEQQSDRNKVQKYRISKEITPFELPTVQIIPNIKIEQDQQQDQFDLVCYEDQKSINQRKKIIKQEQTKNEKQFSPIVQRPVEEEETIQKQIKNEVNITFNQTEKSIFGLTAIHQADLKRQLFCYTNRPQLPDRYPHKKYNYLDKAKLR